MYTITHYNTEGWWTVDVPHDDPWPDIGYLLGHTGPKHPVPAVVTEVVWVPFEAGGPNADSLMILSNYICPCCGGIYKDIAALWDFDFDRAADFFIPYGEYVNGRQLDEGIQAYREMSVSGSQVQ